MDNIFIKSVPAGIRYLSQWNEFRLSNFIGHAILHKQLPGCGFTELALTCPEPVVLCSPRRMLMENKKDQHGDDVYLVVNDYESDLDVDEDVSKPQTISTIIRKDQYFISLLNDKRIHEGDLYLRLFNEIGEYITRKSQEGKPIKIIVTYDSTYLVKRILEQMGIINNFYFCIDEFQSLLDDSRFKSSVEMEFLYILRDISNVLYVSATPMLEKYLVRISELANLPYFLLDWETLDPTRVKKPNLKKRTMSSVTSKLTEIIQSYFNGNYEKAIVERDGQLVEVESNEAVFYVNSVNHIVNIIKKMSLTPDQCNILCSKTPENKRKIEKILGKKSGHIIGKIPLRGEKPKMFTFCTRTVYLGADFYSLCARSFVFSDSNYDSLAVDISNDLNQILGRQRLIDNPWKNSAEFYYRTTCDYKKMTQEDLDEVINKKRKKTDDLLEIYSITPEEKKSALVEKYLKDTKISKYKDDYIAVNRKSGSELVPVFNNLVMINEQRAFDIQQIDYADRFSVFCKIGETFDISPEVKEFDIIRGFFSKYDQLTTYVDKIHTIVDFLILYPTLSDPIINNLVDSDKIKQQLITLGPNKIKGLGYNITKINQVMGITVFDKSVLDNSIISSFKVGDRYTKKKLKDIISNIYKSVGYKGTPKSSIILDYFEVKATKVKESEGVYRDGYEIIKKKQG